MKYKVILNIFNQKPYLCDTSKSLYIATSGFIYHATIYAAEHTISSDGLSQRIPQHEGHQCVSSRFGDRGYFSFIF